MDPDANVKEQKEILERMRSDTADEWDHKRLHELRVSLNGWRARGGFPPKDGWL